MPAPPARASSPDRDERVVLQALLDGTATTAGRSVVLRRANTDGRKVRVARHDVGLCAVSIARNGFVAVVPVHAASGQPQSTAQGSVLGVRE
jgi:hypothetical protein